MEQYILQLAYHKPVMGVPTSTMEGHKPVVGVGIPVMEDHKPVVGVDIPAMKDHKPLMEDHTPVTVVHTPVIEDHTTAMEDHKPVVGIDIPLMEDHIPVIGVHPPAKEVDTPVIGVHTPVTEVHKPVIAVHTPVMEVQKPAMENHENFAFPSIPKRFVEEAFLKTGGNVNELHRIICGVTNMPSNLLESFSKLSLYIKIKEVMKEIKRLNKYQDKTRLNSYLNESFEFPKRRKKKHEDKNVQALSNGKGDLAKIVLRRKHQNQSRLNAY